MFTSLLTRMAAAAAAGASDCLCIRDGWRFRVLGKYYHVTPAGDFSSLNESPILFKSLHGSKMSSENPASETPATEEETAVPNVPESVEEPAAADVADAPAAVESASDAPVEDAAASSAQESDKEGTATVDVNTQPKPEQPKKIILDDGAK